MQSIRLQLVISLKNCRFAFGDCEKTLFCCQTLSKTLPQALHKILIYETLHFMLGKKNEREHSCKVFVYNL